MDKSLRYWFQHINTMIVTLYLRIQNCLCWLVLKIFVDLCCLTFLHLQSCHGVLMQGGFSGRGVFLGLLSAIQLFHWERQLLHVYFLPIRSMRLVPRGKKGLKTSQFNFVTKFYCQNLFGEKNAGT